MSIAERVRRGELSDLAAAVMIALETEVADPVVAPAAEPGTKDKPSALDEAKDAADPKDAHGGAKPPEDGLCRECKRRRKLNRLRLCYPCFAELVLAEEAKKRGVAWKPGDKHPDWCGCEGLGEHTNGDGSARGFN